MNIEESTNIIKSITHSLIEKSEFLTDFGIKNGKMGAILYLFYTSRAFSNMEYQEKAEKLLDDCFNLILKPHKKYHNNLVEFGIGLQHLINEKFIDLGEGDIFKSFDEILLIEFKNRISNNDIGGYYNGATALLPYFIERNKNGLNIENVVILYLNSLVQNSISDENGSYLKSNLFNDGRVYITFPHGIGSIIIILSKFYELSFEKERIVSIVSRYINFILQNKNQYKETGYFFDDILGRSEFSRLSLVYGDLGVGYCLLQAGLIFDNNVWYNIGLEILLESSKRRDENETFCVDANIIYGASGVSLFYNLIYEITGENIFNETANYWKTKIYEFYNPEEEYLGFKTLNNPWFKSTNISFNEGICGIGMFLIESELKINTNIKKFTHLME